MKWPKLVLAEAKNLKKLATKEELDNLNILYLNPRNEFRCIYGQMTGSCFSSRANELIQNCAPRVYVNDKTGYTNDKKLSNKLNGKLREPRKYLKHWSPIEVFIWKESFKEDQTGIEKLVNYLKGKKRILK